MMDAIKTFKIAGAQSHKHTVLHFNRKGVHRISAEGESNSHGKSVIMKMLDVLRGEYLDLEGRRAIIRDNGPYCVGSIESYNGYTLSACIAETSSECFYMLEYQGKSVKKYLTDDYKEILKVLNFHSLENIDYSLNRYKTKTTLPFTHFSGSVNEKILMSASELPNYQINLEILDDNLKTIESDLNLNRARLSSVESNLADISYRYNESDIIDFEIFDVAVNKYDAIAPLYDSLVEVQKHHDSLTELHTNKVIDMSKLNTLVEYLRTLNDFLGSVNNTKCEMIALEELLKNKDEPVYFNHLETLTNPFKDLIRGLSTLKDSLESRNNLQPISKPVLKEINLSNILSLSDVVGSLNNVKTELIKRDNLVIPPEVLQLDALGSLVDTSVNLEELTSLKGLTTELIPVPKPRIKKVDFNSLTEVTKLHTNLNHIIKLQEELINMNNNFVLEPIECNYLYSLVTLSESLTKIENLFTEYNEVNFEKERLLNEIKIHIEENNICPTCGGEMSLEGVLDNVHRH